MKKLVVVDQAFSAHAYNAMITELLHDERSFVTLYGGPVQRMVDAEKLLLADRVLQSLGFWGTRVAASARAWIRDYEVDADTAVEFALELAESNGCEVWSFGSGVVEVTLLVSAAGHLGRGRYEDLGDPF